jgi:serine/threonine protein kinase
MGYTETTFGGYLTSSFQSSNLPNQTITENDNHVAEEGADGILYDFMSFLALVSHSTSYRDWTSIGMNLVHITTSNIALAERKRHGSSFSISLVDRKDLSAILPHDMARLNLPQLLAVKTPILNSPLGAQRNRHIFDSMTREYEILNYKTLQKHENIVRLIGCCWRTVDMESELTVPNLVLEGADLGDLEDFYQRHGRTITMRKRLGLCIDVALGVEALHLAGILHGDIKPRNILVFKNQNRGFIAKIADFGSSIPLYQSTFPRKACPGTTLFAAPELVNRSEDHSRDELLKAEIYTLGLVFVLLVRGLHTLDKLRSARPEDVVSLKKGGELAEWILQEDEHRLFDPMARPTFGKEASERERQRGIWRWLETQEYNRAHALWARGIIPSLENTFDDEDWITLANARLKSEKSDTLFSGLVNRIMSAQPSRRPVNVHHILQDLRQILALELRALYDPNHPRQMLYEEQLASSRRRLNPEGLHEGVSISYLNLQEIDSIILNNVLSYKGSHFVRDFYFIWRFGGIAKFPKKHRPPTRSRWLGLRHQTQTQKRYVRASAICAGFLTLHPELSVTWLSKKIRSRLM